MSGIRGVDASASPAVRPQRISPQTRQTTLRQSRWESLTCGHKPVNRAHVPARSHCHGASIEASRTIGDDKLGSQRRDDAARDARTKRRVASAQQHRDLKENRASRDHFAQLRWELRPDDCGKLTLCNPPFPFPLFSSAGLDYSRALDRTFDLLARKERSAYSTTDVAKGFGGSGASSV